MPTSLLAFLITLRSLIRSRIDLQLENLALRHQIGVLQRSLKKRPKLTSMDRLLWVSLFRIWRDWRSTLAIVKPQTVVAWHRMGFRLFWTWKVRRGQPGRPLIARETRDLIRSMCRENPTWGAPRIHGAAQARHRHRREQCHQVHAALPQATFSNLAHVPRQPLISSPCPQSVSRSSTCFWYWLMIVAAFFTST